MRDDQTCLGECGKTKPWDYFYWHRNQTGTVTRDRFCKACRNEDTRRKSVAKRNGQGHLTSAQMAEYQELVDGIERIQASIIAGRMENEHDVARGRRTIRELKARLSLLPDVNRGERLRG